MILLNYIRLEKVTPPQKKKKKTQRNTCRSSEISRHFEYQYLLNPHQLHVSVNSDVNAQL